MTTGMKSARSFTQHNKDLDVDMRDNTSNSKEGKKNMTATFSSRGAVANEGLGAAGAGQSAVEKRRGEQETFKYSKDSN